MSKKVNLLLSIALNIGMSSVFGTGILASSIEDSSEDLGKKGETNISFNLVLQKSAAVYSYEKLEAEFVATKKEKDRTGEILSAISILLGDSAEETLCAVQEMADVTARSKALQSELIAAFQLKTAAVAAEQEYRDKKWVEESRLKSDKLMVVLNSRLMQVSAAKKAKRLAKEALAALSEDTDTEVLAAARQAVVLTERERIAAEKVYAEGLAEIEDFNRNLREILLNRREARAVKEYNENQSAQFYLID